MFYRLKSNAIKILMPGAAVGAVFLLLLVWSVPFVSAELPTAPAFDGSDTMVLDPTEIPKYVQPLVIPPVMPPSSDPKANYNISVREFQQQILPGGIWNTINTRDDKYPATTVWSYGKAEDTHDLGYTAPMPLSNPAATTFNYPALTVEATVNQLDRVRWINELFDPATYNFLEHLLAVDRTLHWANPELLKCQDGTNRTDCRPGPTDDPELLTLLQQPYDGPVPMVTHVHGAHVNPESDGYPEAWWLPGANNIPGGYARHGAFFDQFDRSNTWPGSALFGYYNTQRAATLWYHDHTLGMTRNNVYAGPAGFWLIRGDGGGEPDLISGVLPGPAPVLGEDPNFDANVRNKIREVPIALQDRTFNPDGSLFYPDNRAFFEELNPEGGSSPTLDIPFYPENAVGDPSDVAPIWNPEAFFNTMVVNGTTWPVYNVAPARYRLRLLNGCNSRFLILKMVDDPLVPRPAAASYMFYQIGAEQGLLPAVAQLDQLLMAPAERADVIVDFTGLVNGTEIYLINEGPDEPFGGGVPNTDFDAADPETTGQVMKFVVDTSLLNAEGSSDGVATPPGLLVLAPREDLVPNAPSRQVSLNEEESMTVFIEENEDGASFDPNSMVPFGPTAALLGTVAGDAASGFSGVPLTWTDTSGTSALVKVFTKSDGTPVYAPVTETPRVNDVEVWEIFNFTADAHPIHVHLVEFEVVDRQSLTVDDEGVATQPAKFVGPPRPPESWETGTKDTVIAFPGEVTRIQAKFDIAGLYVWHCHIVEHEDNEMMRPYAAIPDLNRDDCVDRVDLMALIGQIRSGTGTHDLNGDGVVNIADARRLVLFFTNPGGAPCPSPDS